MNKRSLAYSGILLLALVVTAILLSRGVIQAVVSSSDVAVTVTTSSLAVGSTVELEGTVDVGNNEEIFDRIAIKIQFDDPQTDPNQDSTEGAPDFTVILPVEAGTTTFDKDSPSTDYIGSGRITGTGKLVVTLSLPASKFESTLPATLPSTLPGTLPGFEFKGIASDAQLKYTIKWTGDPLRSPAPPVAATELPGSDLVFAVPGTPVTQQQQQSAGAPAFPTMGSPGPLPLPGLPPSSKARAAAIKGGQVKVVLDEPGALSDLVATFQPGPGGSIFFQGAFQLSTNSDTNNKLGFTPDLTEVQAIDIADGGDVLIAGGSSEEGAYLIWYNPNGEPRNAKPLDTIFDDRPGGIAIDATGGDNIVIYVAERESDPTDKATVAKFLGVVSSASLTADGSFEVPLGFAGLPGFEGLAFNPKTGNIFGSAADGTSNAIIEFDTTGNPLRTEFPVGQGCFPPVCNADGTIADAISGLGIFVNPQNDAELLAVTQDSRTLFFSTLAEAAAAIQALSNQPNFVTEDSETGKIYVGVDGTSGSGDGIVVMTKDSEGVYQQTATLGDDETFTDKVKAGVLIRQSTPVLFVVENGTSTKQKIYRVDPSTGSITLTISVNNMGPAGGLGQDGTNLVIYEDSDDKIRLIPIPKAASTTDFSIDADDSDDATTIFVFDADTSDQFFAPGGAESVEVATINGVQKILAGRFEKIYVIDPASGGLETAFVLGGTAGEGDVTGLGSGSLLLTGLGTLQVRRTSLPGETAIDPTIAGDYTATFQVEPRNAVQITKTTTFDLFTISTLDVTITSPLSNTGVTPDSNGEIDVTGTVNDPTVPVVTLGGQVASTFLMGAPASAPTGPFTLETSGEKSAVSSSATGDTDDWEAKGLWHVTTASQAKVNGSAGFYYGKEPQFNYATGSTNKGDLDSPEFTVGGGTVLTFVTFYFTEPGFDFDQKLIIFCKSTACSGSDRVVVAQLVDFPPPPKPPVFVIPQPGLVFNPADVGANFSPFNDGRKFVFIPNNPIPPGGTPFLFTVKLPLIKALGTGFIRFEFDTVDDIGNQFEGWYVDDPDVQGAGAATGVGFNVVNGVWSGKFKPAEGENDITVNATRSAYLPVLTDSDTVTVFLDTVNPVVSFDAPNLPSKSFSPTTGFVSNDRFLTGVIKGRFTELAPDSLEIFKVDSSSLSGVQSLTLFSTTTLVSIQKSFVATELELFAAEGDTVIEVKSVTGMSVGDLIQIDLGTDAEERTISALDVSDNDITVDSALDDDHDADVPVSVISFTPKGNTVDLGDTDGFVRLGVRLTDKSGLTKTDELLLLLDTTAPTAVAKVLTLVSDGEAVVGDQLFVLVAASDAGSGVATTTADSTTLVPIASVEPILVEMFGLGTVNSTTTHAQLITVGAGTPVGTNELSITITDFAGNSVTGVKATFTVVSARTNRNYFIFPGFTFVGLALIPDDLDASTTDDDDLDRLMDQDISGLVNAAFKTAHTHVGHATSSLVTLGDVIESTFAFSDAGNFLKHSPGPGAADTLTDLKAFQGMIVKTKDNPVVGGNPIEVFKQVSVTGFAAQQAVPIKMNVKGVFFQTGELTPPEDTLRAGYNLSAPHILTDTLFDTALRGALIPNELAVSAITFERRVDASQSGSGVAAQIFEGFVSNSIGDNLKPVLSYWVFIVSGTPTITP